MGTKHTLLLMAGVVALPAAAALSAPGVSRALQVSVNEEPAFMLSGSGVHVYECRPAASAPDTYGWSFVAPDATLYDGTRSAARLATPNLLESLSDRTSVSGIVRATQAGGGDNLPWMVMSARPVGDSGLFAEVTSIQRVNTRGGMAPSGGCTADTVGNEARVAYSADYYFYKRRGAS